MVSKNRGTYGFLGTSWVLITMAPRNRAFAIYTELCWVGNHINIIMKPTNSPTQGQPNPRKIRLKVAFGPLFPTANNFSWVGIDFM